ncbi:MAG: cation ABC transporter substrate-binding protein [Epsilonproteobacteria bacterium]|nr:cation ABC transporter substrate-binding protein [Campylobacterota bacterium]NPA64900.1 zinc ABC transporter solute-binding protein [Campylobacterota bacterium]
MRYILLLFLWLPLFAREIIAVSILPQKYIVDRIVGEAFETIALLPPGASPATFAPKPSTILKLKKSKLYLTIGVPFEQALLSRIETPSVDMGRYLKRFAMDHHHEEHDHEGLDPHLWLSPPHIMLLARATLQEAIHLDPKAKETFLHNYRTFIKELGALDAKIYKKILRSSTKSFLVYHPSFGYFAKVYDLRQIAIEQEGKEPKPKELMELVKLAKKERIETIFIEPQFPKKSALFLAKKLGAKVVTIDPLAYDLLSNLEKIADAVSRR